MISKADPPPGGVLLDSRFVLEGRLRPSAAPAGGLGGGGGGGDLSRWINPGFESWDSSPVQG